MKRKLLPLLLTVVLIVAAAIVPMLAVTAAAETTTVSKDYKEMAASVGVTSTSKSVNGLNMPLDENITVRFDKASSGTAPTYYGESIRLYQNGGTVTITAEDGVVMSKIVITVASDSAGKGPISVTGGTASALSGSNYTITVNDNTPSVVVKTTGTSKTQRLYVTNIAVTYDTATTEPEPDPDVPACEHTNKETVVTVPATKGDAGSESVICKDCGTELEKKEIPALGYTVNFVVPEGAEPVTHPNTIEAIMPKGPDAPENFNMYEYSFAGWATAAIDGEVTEAPTLYKEGDKVKITADDTTFYAVYMRAEGGTGESGWIATDVSEIKSTDTVVIVWTNSSGGTFAATNSNSTGSAPAASKVTIADGKITSTVADNIKWNITNNNGTLTIYKNGTTASWMYCTSTNNGVRVGNNAAKTFVIEGDYLKHEGTNRYLGIYNSQDLRCYTTSTTDNIKNQTVAFYVLTESGTAFYSTTLLEDSGECEHKNQTTTTVDAKCEEDGSITVTCDDCGKQISFETIESEGHDWDEGTILPGDEATCSKEGIKTFTCQNDENHTKTEKIDIAAHSYDAETHLCIYNCGKFDPMFVDYSGRYYIATSRGEGKNFFWMTSEVASNRYNAKDSALAELPEKGYFDTTVFVIEKNEDGTYCIYAEGIEGDNYLGWTSGNSGTFVAKDKALALTVDQLEDGRYNIHFAASDGERYLSLNEQASNNYFAFYKGTQKQDLTLVKAPKITVNAASVTLGADLSVNYYIELTNADIADVKVIFTMNGKQTEVTAYTIDGNEFVFTFTGIAPQAMGDVITAEFYLGENLLTTFGNYSVATNLKNIYATTESDAVKVLVTDTLNYGAAAQKYTKYNVENLVNAGWEGIGSNTVPESNDSVKKVVTAATTEGYNLAAAGVQFDFVNKVYVKINAASLEGLTVECNGKALEIEKLSAGTYIAYTEALSALDFATELNITLKLNGEVIHAITYSVNSYAFAMAEDADMSELAIALYRYGASAKTYKNQ